MLKLTTYSVPWLTMYLCNVHTPATCALDDKLIKGSMHETRLLLCDFPVVSDTKGGLCTRFSFSLNSTDNSRKDRW